MFQQKFDNPPQFTTLVVYYEHYTFASSLELTYLLYGFLINKILIYIALLNPREFLKNKLSLSFFQKNSKPLSAYHQVARFEDRFP